MAKLRIPVLVLLFATAAIVESVRLSSLSAQSSSDVWWHLSSGLWMLDHHAFPRTGIFSQSPGLPWIASSWGYDLLLAIGYKLLGLRSIPVLSMCFRCALAALTFLLAGGMRGRFWTAVVLSTVAQYVLGTLPAGPVYSSAVLFGLELLILFESRRRADLRLLWWLPLLLVVWANLHMQFVYGAALAVVFAAAVACQGLLSPPDPLPIKNVAAIAGLSLAAGLVTPYFYRPYGVFFATAFSSANRYLSDFNALGFRRPQDYVLLLLAMAAFLALGLRRSRDVFQIALLSGCLVLAFYSQRDLWLITLAAIAVIGEAIARPACVSDHAWKWKRELAIGTAVAVMLVFASALHMPRSRETLLIKVGQSYPVAACDFIRQSRLPQPLFNAYEWGGFLTWYLPEYPVAIDGRTDLYGSDSVTRYFQVISVEIPYTAYPAMTGAKTILLPKNSIMAGALALLPEFRTAYSDDVSMVLVRRDGAEGSER